MSTLPTVTSTPTAPPRPAARRTPLNWAGLARRYAVSVALFAAVLASLEWLVPLTGMREFVVPRPSSVALSALDVAHNWPTHVGTTAAEGIGGLLLGSLLACLVAVAFVHVPPLEHALYPWVIVLQTIPLVALAPLLVIWFGNGLLPRLAMAAIFCFFPVLVNTTRGLRFADRTALDLLRSYGATRWQLFWKLRVPMALPFLFTGLKIGATLAIIGAIVGEFAGASAGLGFVVTVSTYYLDTARTFAAVAYASLLSLSLYTLLVLLERQLVFWQPAIDDPRTA